MSQANASEAPAPGGDAVDRADDRLVEPPHREDERVVALADLGVERRGVGLEALAQVLPGAERAAGTGEDHDPDGRVPGDVRGTLASALP